MFQIKNKIVISSIIFLLVPTSNFTLATDIYVACASNFKPAFEKIASRYQVNSGDRILVNYGSSSKMYFQIKMGAPYSLFLSADKQKITSLVENNFAEKKFQRTYAIGRLALWSIKKIDVLNGAYLYSPKLQRLALADSKLAPYGLAAEQTLSAMRVVEKTQKHWVRTHNASQVYHMVSTGNVDVGFVPVSYLINQNVPFDEKVWIVPSHYHNSVYQDMVLVNDAHKRPEVLNLWRFIQSPESKEIIKSFGYDLLE